MFCRVRPLLSEDEGPSCVDVASDTCLRVNKKSFEFDRVFSSDTNQGTKITSRVSRFILLTIFSVSVFNEVKPLIVSVLDGFNVCIACYGQTASGKTYTMVNHGNFNEIYTCL